MHLQALKSFSVPNFYPNKLISRILKIYDTNIYINKEKSYEA